MAGEEALAALRRAIDEGLRGTWWFETERNLNLELLHDEPEFQAMINEIRADMVERLGESEVSRL